MLMSVASTGESRNGRKSWQNMHHDEQHLKLLSCDIVRGDTWFATCTSSFNQ